MYTREQLTVYPYFSEYLSKRRISDVLDPLTGLVSRVHMQEFIQSLIDSKTPFTYGMVDLDNFKYINDTYGHHVGDIILSEFSDALSGYVGDRGIVGRFGGDEFLLVNVKDLDYASKKLFCKGMYSNFTVMRRTYKAEEYELFMTGTTGLSTFPYDTADLKKLFSNVDKTLYRGKTKGRNCYIIYVEEKHKDIEIRSLKKASLYEIFQHMAECFDSSPMIREKLNAICSSLERDIFITDLFVMGKKKYFFSVRDGRVLGESTDVGRLVDKTIFTTNKVEEIKDEAPEFYTVLKNNELETAMVSEIRTGPFFFGYIMFAEPHNLRIWQDSEKAVMFSLGRMIAGFLVGSSQDLD